MKILIAIILLLPKLVWAESYKITKPGIIFISKEELIKNIDQSNDLNGICNLENYASYELLGHKADYDLRGAYIGDRIRQQFNPLLKIYCEYIVAKLNGDNDIQEISNQKIISAYTKLIETNYLLNFHKDVDNSDHAYATSHSVIPIMFIYSLNKQIFSDQEQKNIENMFLELIKKNEFAFSEDLVGESTYSNHGLYINNSRLLYSILVNDQDMYNKSVKFFNLLMKKNKTKSGLFRIDSKRGECALHYNLHNLTPLMSTLWNLKLQGLNFLNDKINGSHTLDEIVSIIIKSVDEPSIVINENKIQGYNQSGRKTCSSDTETVKVGNDEIRMPYESTMWFSPYYSLSGNKQNYDNFSKSMLSNKYFYDGTVDSNIVSYFYKFIYLDPYTKKSIEFDKLGSKDDLLKELEFAIQ